MWFRDWLIPPIDLGDYLSQPDRRDQLRQRNLRTINLPTLSKNLWGTIQKALIYQQYLNLFFLLKIYWFIIGII